MLKTCTNHTASCIQDFDQCLPRFSCSCSNPASVTRASALGRLRFRVAFSDGLILERYNANVMDGSIPSKPTFAYQFWMGTPYMSPVSMRILMRSTRTRLWHQSSPRTIDSSMCVADGIFL